MAVAENSGSRTTQQSTEQEFDGKASRHNSSSPEAELVSLLAQDLQRYLREQVSFTEGSVDQWYETLGERSKRTVKDVGKVYQKGKAYVGEHPVESVVGAFAIGAVIGIISKQ